MLGNTLEIIAPIKHTDARLLFNLANKKNKRVLIIDDILTYLREMVHLKELLSRAEYLVY
jgi:adenine/guanine phosphoribosyltransferase-like PRPP-binding protein